MKTNTEKFRQRRRFAMMLPLLTFPFLTLIFWALGGGQGVPATVQASSPKGLNFNLPDAHFDANDTWNKLALYQRADRDSAKFEEARESDPYFDLIAFKAQASEKTDQDTSKSHLIDQFQQKDRLAVDPNVERVNKKLEELNSELLKAKTPTPHFESTQPDFQTKPDSDKQFTSDVERLENMMQAMKESPESDPEMDQIESVLEKILDIQHPERVQERLNEQRKTQDAQALPVIQATDNENISLLKSQERVADAFDSVAVFQSLQYPVQTNGFFGLNDNNPNESTQSNAIQAVIHDTQELVAGSTVKLRLLTDVIIGGIKIAKDQFVYGTCAINGERLTIDIKSLRAGNSILPVSLSVYDLDGLEGIYIPGAIIRDAAKQASDNAMQNVQLMSLDTSIGAQAATAGVEAAKGLFSKKAKMVKVTVKAGYKVLLKDKNPGTQQDFNF